MRTDTWIEELPTPLTPTERAERGREMARGQCELGEHEQRAKSIKADLKAKADQLTTTIKDLARAVDTGKEKRPIECYETVDVRRFQVNVIRMDTGEVVRSRAMDKTEREAAVQGQLFERDPNDVRANRAARTAVAQASRDVEAVTVEADGTSGTLDAEAVERLRDEARPVDEGTVDNPNPLPEPIPEAD